MEADLRPRAHHEVEARGADYIGEPTAECQDEAEVLPMLTDVAVVLQVLPSAAEGLQGGMLITATVVCILHHNQARDRHDSMPCAASQAISPARRASPCPSARPSSSAIRTWFRRRPNWSVGSTCCTPVTRAVRWKVTRGLASVPGGLLTGRRFVEPDSSPGGEPNIQWCCQSLAVSRRGGR